LLSASIDLAPRQFTAGVVDRSVRALTREPIDGALSEVTASPAGGDVNAGVDGDHVPILSFE
jgi:hypothetical protein